jgi:hypothetical protein
VEVAVAAAAVAAVVVAEVAPSAAVAVVVATATAVMMEAATFGQAALLWAKAARPELVGAERPAGAAVQAAERG